MSNSIIFETSLTAPEDRKYNQTKNPEDKWKVNPNHEKLNKDETIKATEELNISLFPRIERGYCDPSILNQTIGLFSFIPANGATPNKNGVFGYGKIRGVYNSIFEANTKATEIIKKFDSIHKIFHVNVGHPFPITNLSIFSKDINEIDINEDLKINEENRKVEDEKEIENIKERQKKLLDSQNTKPDDLELYIVQQVKLANLKWMFNRYEKELKDTQNKIIDVEENIKKLDNEFPNYLNEYKDKYFKACKEVGLDTTNMGDDNFIKYLN